MDWSTRKKMGCFAMIGIVVLLVAGYLSYKFFFSVAPTCSDGKQNQNERGVDCGGLCDKMCLADTKSIVRLWTRVFRVTPGVYSAVAYIENQNVTAGTAQVAYEFRFYDDENLLVSEPVTGTTFIGPNERTAIFVSAIKTGNRVPTHAFLTWKNVPEWIRVDQKYSVPQLTSANTVLTETDTAPKLSADVINNSLFDYQNIPVVVILYGADGNAVAASQTLIENIPQQTTQKVYFTWPQPFDVPVTRIEIIPRLNPFVQE